MAGSGPILWGEKGPGKEEIQEFAYKSRRRPEKHAEEAGRKGGAREEMPGSVQAGAEEEQKISGEGEE